MAYTTIDDPSAHFQGKSYAGNFFTPCLEHAGVTYTIESNFGNPPYSVSSTQADDAGYGNFEYDVPAGFYSWNTKNLAKHG